MLVGTTWTARQLPLDDALAVVRDAGLTAVEIWAEGVHLDPRVGSGTPHLPAGLDVVSVHLPFVVPGGSDSWVELCVETLRTAAELGALVAVAHPVIYGDPSQFGVRRLGDALNRIADQASALGLRLAVENMHTLRGPTLRSVSEILAVVDPATGVCLDVGHAIFNDVRPSSEVHAARGRLLNMHIHDSDRVGADPHLIPGDGIADWPALLGALTSIDYSGPFVLEIDGGTDPLGRLTLARSRFEELLRG